MSLLNKIYRKQFEKKRKCNNVSEIPCKKARKKNPPLKDSHEIILEKIVDGGKKIKEKSFEVEVKYNYAIIYLNKDVKIVEENVMTCYENGYLARSFRKTLNDRKSLLKWRVQLDTSVIKFCQTSPRGQVASMRGDVWRHPYKIIRINHDHDEEPVIIGRLKNRSRLTGDGELKNRYRNYNAFWYFEPHFDLLDEIDGVRLRVKHINVDHSLWDDIRSRKKELRISFRDDKNTHIVSENIIIKEDY